MRFQSHFGSPTRALGAGLEPLSFPAIGRRLVAISYRFGGCYQSGGAS
jgi:hypothetical protein